jgi:hypothetical protein
VITIISRPAPIPGSAVSLPAPPGLAPGPCPAPVPDRAPGGFVFACPDCATSAGPFPERAEAVLLAGIHDRLHHRGARTAHVSEDGVCESCRSRPATVVWPYPPAGAPFQLYQPCWTRTQPHPQGEARGRGQGRERGVTRCPVTPDPSGPRATPARGASGDARGRSPRAGTSPSGTAPALPVNPASPTAVPAEGAPHLRPAPSPVGG